MARTPVATDDFEAYTVGSFPGSNWTDLDNNNGQIRVVTGKGVNNAFSANSTMRRSAGTYSADQYVEGTLAGITGTLSGQRVGVCVRCSADASPGQDAYIIYVDEIDTQSLVIARINNDTVTVLATQAGTSIISGDKISLEVSGVGATVTLNGFINTTVQASLTNVADSSASRLTAAGRPGVFGHTSGAVNIGAWEGGDVTAAVVIMLRYPQIWPQELPFMAWPSGLVWRGAVPANWENELMSMRQLFVLP